MRTLAFPRSATPRWLPCALVLGFGVRAAHAQAPPPRSAGPPAQTASSSSPAAAAPTPDPTPVPAPAPDDATPDAEPAWQDAPRPDQASGIERDAPTPLRVRLRVIPRAILFVPRLVVWVAAQPFRLGAYAYEKLDLAARTRSALFNTEETFGVYPTASYESDFGITGGVRVVHTNLLGHSERLRLRADFGGRFRQAYGFSLRSGGRFGEHFIVEVGTLYERRPNERFYGIGNGDELAQPPAMPIDPLADEAAIATRFREDVVRSVAVLDGPLVGGLTARLSGVAMMRDFTGTDDADSIDMAYDTARLPGYAGGVDNLYLEAELAYDSRRPTSIYQSRVIDATGWLATAHFGAVAGLGDDPSDYYRYGGELQRFFDLYRGSRVLALRLIVDAVGGTDGRDGKIAFVDLPRLGGSEYLRGYPNGRFRDRAITLASAEYTWDLGNFLAAYAFVDAGRAWRSLADVELRDDVRVGYGGGVQFHTRKSFVLRGQIAASRDGDVFLEIALTPAFGRRERAGRF